MVKWDKLYVNLLTELEKDKNYMVKLDITDYDNVHMLDNFMFEMNIIKDKIKSEIRLYKTLSYNYKPVDMHVLFDYTKKLTVDLKNKYRINA